MEASPLTIVQPAQGPVGNLGSIGVVFKLWGADTGGSVSIVEHHGLIMAPAEWLPDLISRYDLTPPPMG